MNIHDIYNYFEKIDSIKQDGIIDSEEFKQAKKINSIFSSILKENMSYDEYFLTFVKTYRENIDTGNINSSEDIYKMEIMPNTQSWDWEIVDKILTKDEVDSDIYNIKTKENCALDSKLNFNNSDGEYMLKHLSFDEKTFENIPKENLPENWNPKQIIEAGKDAGMNVKKMNKMGYTGKNITCAVIDTPIIKHKDIKSSLVGYEIMDSALAKDEPANFHGQATSDILCGNEVGIAKDANLVYFAESSDDDKLQALHRILEINKKADENGEPNKKIKVVSLSWGFLKNNEKYNEYSKLLKQLYDSGVFVATADYTMIDENITGAIMERNHLSKRSQTANQNDYSNYVPENDIGLYPERSLFVLSGDRTVASAKDPNSFRHDSQFSTSWSIPSLAGIYACALQCAEENNIELTPKDFWQYALDTGVEMHDKDGKFVGKAIDAEALVKYIKNLKNKNS
jgi:subtilisin family serine protease